MLAPSHIVFGSSLSLILLSVFGVSLSLHWSIILVAMLGSLLPDIDMPKSTIGRLFPFISKPIERKFGHRTVTHSLIGWMVATLISAILITAITFIPILKPYIPTQLPLRWCVSFSIGYFSHILLDMFNPRGAQLFWPNPARDVIPGNLKYRIKSGSKAEFPVFVGLMLLLLVSLPISRYGVMSSLRWLLATPESAIQEFKTSQTMTYVVFEGMLNQSRVPVSGTAEVIDTQNKRLLIRISKIPKTKSQSKLMASPLASYPDPETKKQTLPEGRLYTLSSELSSDIVASQVRSIKTTTLIQIKRFEFQQQEKDALLSQIPKGSLISGVIRLPKGAILTIPSSASTHDAIRQSKSKLILDYATKEDLETLDLGALFGLRRQKNQAKLQHLEQEIVAIKLSLQTSPKDGLTDLGRAALRTPDEIRKEAQKKDALLSKIQAKRLQRDELSLRLKESSPLFSGHVSLRLPQPLLPGSGG